MSLLNGIIDSTGSKVPRGKRGLHGFHESKGCKGSRCFQGSREKRTHPCVKCSKEERGKKGPRGPRGKKGARGPRGKKGATGETPTLLVGGHNRDSLIIPTGNDPIYFSVLDGVGNNVNDGSWSFTPPVSEFTTPSDGKYSITMKCTLKVNNLSLFAGSIDDTQLILSLNNTQMDIGIFNRGTIAIPSLTSLVVATTSVNYFGTLSSGDIIDFSFISTNPVNISNVNIEFITLQIIKLD